LDASLELGEFRARLILLRQIRPESTSYQGGPLFLHSYPRPQLERPEWQPLNGMWEFAIDPEARWQQPAEVEWDSEILVPFAPETAASGIADTTLYRSCWYRRTFEAPQLEEGQALILHFGAVDYFAKVWVNGQCVVEHEGGYTPFSADVTLVLGAGDQPQEIVVRAEDDPTDLAKPRGKQDWEVQPHSIWYPRTTGIWQTVWMEVVSKTYLQTLRWTPSLDRWEIHMGARTAGLRQEGLRLRVRMSCRGQILADDTYAVVNGEVHRSIQFSDPGIDDYRNKLLWSPRQPTLIDAELELSTR
jgi:beta-galactosidase/beta-glucuronidase